MSDADLDVCVPYESIQEVCQDWDVPRSGCTARQLPVTHGFDGAYAVSYEAEDPDDSELGVRTELLVLRTGDDYWLVALAREEESEGTEQEHESFELRPTPAGMELLQTASWSDSLTQTSESGTTATLLVRAHGAPRERLSLPVAHQLRDPQACGEAELFPEDGDDEGPQEAVSEECLASCRARCSETHTSPSCGRECRDECTCHTESAFEQPLAWSRDGVSFLPSTGDASASELERWSMHRYAHTEHRRLRDCHTSHCQPFCWHDQDS